MQKLTAEHKEVWKPIAGYNGHYSVSNLGRVRRDKKGSGTWIGKILSKCPDKNGYCIIVLSKMCTTNTFKLHRIVANSFLGKCPKGYQINHIDGNKSNNHFYNLEYVTPKDNIRHAHENGLMNYCFGSKNGMVKITQEDVVCIRKEYDKSINSETVLAKKYRISRSQIGRIIRRERWSHVK